MKVKPHVCKRSLTSASALYSFLTAARIPAVGPGTDRQGREGGRGAVVDSTTPPPPTRSKRPERRGRLWSNAGILFIIFSLHFTVFYFLRPKSLLIKLMLVLILFLTRTRAGFLSPLSGQCGFGGFSAGYKTRVLSTCQI